jgi:hypothetical protein
LRKTPFFRQKLAKIAENCDHNIDPRFGEFSPNGRLFTVGSLKTYLNIPNFGPIFTTVKVMYKLWKINVFATFWVILLQSHLVTLH